MCSLHSQSILQIVAALGELSSKQTDYFLLLLLKLVFKASTFWAPSAVPNLASPLRNVFWGKISCKTVWRQVSCKPLFLQITHLLSTSPCLLSTSIRLSDQFYPLKSASDLPFCFSPPPQKARSPELGLSFTLSNPFLTIHWLLFCHFTPVTTATSYLLPLQSWHASMGTHTRPL